MKKVLILGSGGQIGAYLTEYLRKKDYDVREFDITNGEHQDMRNIPNPELHRNVMTADFVFFLAFDVGGSRYLKKYQHTFDFVNNNARIMVNVFGLLEIPGTTNIKCKKEYKVRSHYLSMQFRIRNVPHILMLTISDIKLTNIIIFLTKILSKVCSNLSTRS